MSNFDDIFEGKSSGYRREDKTFDKEAWPQRSRQSARKFIPLRIPQRKPSSVMETNSGTTWMYSPGLTVTLPPMHC
jgi:hypothetical protein